MKSQILLVEPSSTMRHVVKNYAEDAGHDVVSYSGYGEAATVLKSQFDDFNTDINCLLLGWPASKDRESNRLLGMLESVDYHDLPVIVLSQEMRPDSKAWVAGRDHSVLIRWKDYRVVDELMTNLLDKETTEELTLLDASSARQDIHVLVVESSTTIRQALRDLLQVHGYRVSVAATAEESQKMVAEQDIDLCLIDFNLRHSTGDQLCRDLLTSQNNSSLICAVLTSSYTDQIVKRSLLSGATECLYKNEASEILLARIDALGAVVRDRRQLVIRQSEFGAVLDAIAGSVLSFDETGAITFFNDSAQSVLGFHDSNALHGLSVGESVCLDLPGSELGKRHRGQFKTHEGDAIEVLYKCFEFKRTQSNPETVVVFRTEDEVKKNGARGEILSSTLSASPDISVDVDPPASLFMDAMTSARQRVPVEGGVLALLMIDVGFVGEDKVLKSVEQSPSAIQQLNMALRQVYRHENHVEYLNDGKFGVLLKHDSDQQAYLLTRRIMQIVNDIGKGTGLGEFSCTGALLSLDRNPSLSAEDIFFQLRQGIKLVESRGRNNALLLDLKRLLPVYPKS